MRTTRASRLAGVHGENWDRVSIRCITGNNEQVAVIGTGNVPVVRSGPDMSACRAVGSLGADA